MSTIPQALSKGEEIFAMHCQAYRLDPIREHQFCERKWRFDFAFIEQKVAVEVEGGTWILGRHNRGSSIEKDLAKYNRAAREGWTVLRYSTAMIVRGEAIDEVLEVLRDH